jgi:hypothetical protein
VNPYDVGTWQRIDWRVLLHRLPGLLALVAIAIGLAWLGSRYVSKPRQAALGRFSFLLILYVAVAAQTLTTYMFAWGFGRDWYLEPMITGTFDRPFVYRRLTPDLIRATSNLAVRVLPERVLLKIEHQSHVRRFLFPGDTSRHYTTPADTIPYVVPPESWYRQKALDYHAAYAVEFLSFLAILVIARAWTRELFPEAPLFADIAPAVGLILRLYTQPAHMYDAPETLLLLASAMCVTRRAVWVHLLVFTIAMLNKESDLLLIPMVFIALSGAIPRRRWIAAGIAHTVIGLGILVWLYSTYAHNPGGVVAHHLTDNIMFWANPRSYFRVSDVFAPSIRTPIGANPLLLIPLVVLLVAGWGSSPSAIQRMFVTSAVFLIPLFVLYADRDEIRDFSLASAPIYAMACFGARRLYALDRTVPVT